MRARVIGGLVAVAVLVVPLIMPGVLAQDYTTTTNRQINLQPDPAFAPNQDINLADIGAGNVTAPDLEKDFLNPAFMETGRYVGPYLHSSKLRFTYDTGGTLAFSVTYNFTPEEIMSGSSEFWVRWPIDTSDYVSYCLVVTGIFAPSAFSTGGYYRCSGNAADGTPMSSYLSLGSFVIADSTGLYEKEWNGMLSDHDYTFTFLGYLRSGVSPSIWLTIERYQLEQDTTYYLNNTLTGSQHREDLPLYPAFAFNFIQGIGEGGLTSYNVPFGGSDTDFLVKMGYVGTGTLFTSTTSDCAKYLSFYVPFFGADDVDWKITLAWEDLRAPPYPSENKTTFWVNGTRDFLLASTPWTIDTITNGYCSLLHGLAPDFWVYVRPNKPVILLGSVSSVNNGVWYLSLGGQSIWGKSTAELGVLGAFTDGWFPTWIPVFIDVQATSGRWAQVTPGPIYAVYNFGWGRAYRFPGSVRLTMFLNNGTAIGYDSVLAPAQNARCSPVTNDTGQTAGWINGLACFIQSLIGDVVGFIATVFQTLWNAIKTLGEWIYNALVSFVKLLISVATAIVDIVTQIAITLVYATPFILVLFVSAKALPETSDLAERASRRLTRTYRRIYRKGKA